MMTCRFCDRELTLYPRCDCEKSLSSSIWKIPQGAKRKLNVCIYAKRYEYLKILFQIMKKDKKYYYYEIQNLLEEYIGRDIRTGSLKLLLNSFVKEKEIKCLSNQYVRVKDKHKDNNKYYYWKIKKYM